MALIKPFYALFFLAFGLVEWASHPDTCKTTLKTWSIAGLTGLALMALEVYAWRTALRAETFRYLRHAWRSEPVRRTPSRPTARTPLHA